MKNTPFTLDDLRLDRSSGIHLPVGQSAAAGYLDGAEQFLLEQLPAVGDLSVGAPELDALMRDWPTRYHLTPYRATILDCLGFTGAQDARVLELGAGCGAITRWLGEHFAEVHAIEGNAARARVTRERCGGLDGVHVHAANYSLLDEHASFDVATLIGVLEYGHLYHPEHREQPEAAAVANLEVARRALTSDGVLVLAIENRLGLKYLNGAREDHSGRLFEGIEGYPDRATPVTFSLRALISLLRQAGFPDADVLLPFPDYKLAATIVNPARCEDAQYIHNWVDAPAPDRGAERAGTLFNESLATRELARAGLLADLANSFLVVAYAGDRADAVERLGLELDWSARHYALDRHVAFRKRVTLAGDQVEHAPARLGRAAGAGDVQAAMRAAFGLVHEPGVEPFRRGELLILEVMESLARGGGDETIGAHVAAFRRWLLAELGAGDADGDVPLVRGDALDVTWWNVVVDAETGAWHRIDLEWRLEESLPVDFVVWRMLTHFVLRHRVQLPAALRSCAPAELVDRWLRAAGTPLPPAAIARFEALDAALQRAIADGPAAAGPAPELAAVRALASAPRAFSVLSLAEEIAADPTLLEAYAAHFAAHDAATLIVYAPDTDPHDAAEAVEAAMAAARLAEGGPDVMLLPVPASRETEATLLREAAALLSERAAPAPFAALPRFGGDHAVALRQLAESVWAV